MPATQDVQAISISSLSPAVVDRHWEGLVKIHGSGFDKLSFASFNSATPEVLERSDSHLVVEIHPDLTANPSRIRVKVHTIESGASNELEFVVR